MAGIYIHIPFCKQACTYCNFHFSTSLKQKERMVAALCREIEMQHAYLQGEVVSSLYFGGGTPSLLTVSDIDRMMHVVAKCFTTQLVEVTLEANPDDLNKQKLSDLKFAGINRLSIGVQSFSDSDLQWMNRAHTFREAAECIDNAHAVGFENLSVDLIYGIPGLSEIQWEQNLNRLIQYGIPHISCYALTIEPKTALFHAIENNKIQVPDELQAATNFYTLLDRMEESGYEHYEISNFAKDKRYAVHNTSYWNGSNYLGIGPSAHSFNGSTRSWNVANNALYLHGIEQGTPYCETELLSNENMLNELMMTSLRTCWGVHLNKLKGRTDEKQFSEFMEAVEKHMSRGNLQIQNETLLLTRQGKFYADGIISDLFII